LIWAIQSFLFAAHQTHQDALPNNALFSRIADQRNVTARSKLEKHFTTLAGLIRGKPIIGVKVPVSTQKEMRTTAQSSSQSFFCSFLESLDLL
jgi:hypothetical protein